MDKQGLTRQQEIEAEIIASAAEPCSPEAAAIRGRLDRFDRLFREEGHVSECALGMVWRGKGCTCSEADHG